MSNVPCQHVNMSTCEKVRRSTLNAVHRTRNQQLYQMDFVLHHLGLYKQYDPTHSPTLSVLLQSAFARARFFDLEQWNDFYRMVVRWRMRI